MVSYIEDNIKGIQKEVSNGVHLIAVSKTRTIEEMEVVYSFGLRDFGENKVQELVNKIQTFHQDVRWHLIGHLQKNKVKYIAGKVFLIHSLDSIELLNEIEKRYLQINSVADCLIQINIGREETKSGIALEEYPLLLEACEKCKNVKIRGLMAIIPKGNEDSCKIYFQKMKKIWDETKSKQYTNISMDYLSMGMTGDYRIAVKEGTNMIRIGEGIFGKRIYNNK